LELGMQRIPELGRTVEANNAGDRDFSKQSRLKWERPSKKLRTRLGLPSSTAIDSDSTR